MIIEQRRWTQKGWETLGAGRTGTSASLVLVFGAPALLDGNERLAEVSAAFPQALCVGCSTAGEICGAQVTDDTLVATAIQFAATQVRGARVSLAEVADAGAAGERLAAQLPAEIDGAGGTEPLRHVLVFSEGLRVNGSELVRGLAAKLPAGVTVSGGLAGDGARFVETLVVYAGRAERGTIAAVGLYSRRLRIGYSSLGGWDPFGPERLITRAQGNVLYEFDGQSALGLYKKYLGEHAQRLPASALLFPLSLRTKSGDAPVVRTILSIDEASQGMTFAGDVPEGSYARLMKANFDRLIDGATDSARTSSCALEGATAELALLISCVGRKLLLRQRVEEEVEGVREVLGGGTALAGFYSYGEISPPYSGGRCELHNQTMHVTVLTEA